MNYKIVVFALFAILLGCALASSNHHHSSTPAPTKSGHHSTPAPTVASHHSTPAPTAAPTQASGHHKSTQAPTVAPTQSSTHKSTQAPTAAPTQASTHKSTQAPTTKPSSSSGSSTNLCGITSTNDEPLQLLVPLYVYPGSDWDTVATAAKSGVKIIAIINPNSGPDASGPDSSYVSYMAKLTAAGVDMVGYVHTSYGARSTSDVNADIDAYASKYPGLKGIFLDEGSPSASDIPYYTTVYNHIISKAGYANTIINPGTQPDAGYMAISTNIVIFEDEGSSLSDNFSTWVTCAPTAAEKSGYKYRFSGIAHSTASNGMSSILNTMANSGMGLVYVTDGAAGCCTYNELTSYFASEASSVAAMN